MMDKTSIAKLLGRPLTSSEDSNFEQYINYTISTLENLLCWSPICTDATASYQARDGYRTLWTDPFTSITDVKVDGTAVTDYKLAFNGNFNYPFYNSVVFPYPLGEQTVEITGIWGFDELPADLGSLVAEIFKMYGRVSSGNMAGNVTNKRVEDFSISYGDKSEMDTLATNNSSVISKYSNCQSAGEIAHGEAGGCDGYGIHSIRY
jgi:hypothetical protein